MERSFGLLFYLKKRGASDEVEVSIFMRLTVDADITEISVKRKCSTSAWDAIRGRKKGRTEEVRYFNAYLDTIEQKVYEAKRKLIERNEEIQVDKIKELFLGRDIFHKKYMLLEIFATHNHQLKELVGKQYAANTLIRFTTAYKLVRKFLLWKYKVSDINIKELNYEFVSDLEFWFKSVRSCNHNTAMKYIGNLRKVVNRCIKNGWLQRDPFFGYKMSREEVERTALTQKELDTIAEKIFIAPRLGLVRDMFLFSCYSGLAYVDVSNLGKQDVVIGADGAEWILSRRTKTRTLARIPLLAPAKRILAQYASQVGQDNNARLLPVLSNQKMNAYLKEIADVCGIHTVLTFHLARHTFATTVTLSNGVPIETVSKMLGHRDIRTTQLYAKVVDKKILDDMAEVKLMYK